MSASCPLCGAASVAAFATPDRNRRTGGGEFRYRRCTGCRVIFLENVPDDLSAHYSNGYHRVPAPDEIDAWAQYEAYKIDLVARFAGSGRIVDIGSSYGAFPYLASRRGYDVTAIEADPAACLFMRDVLELRALQSTDPADVLGEQTEPVDVITLWHSIEHLRDPWVVLDAASQRLRAGGVLVVATPNPEGMQARWLKGRWTHVDAPRHLFLIPPRSLLERAQRLQLRPRAVSSRDVETRRCNRSGWQQGLREAGLGFPGVWWLGAGLSVLARPLERGAERGSAYVAVLERLPG